MALLDMLNHNPIFQEMPIDKRHVLTTLAQEFEENELALYLTPKELTHKLNVGNAEQWQLFLSLDPVINYIKKETAERVQIAQRKGLLALQQAASQGNVQAAKEINEMAGIYQQADKNKIVVLHRVNRPKTTTQTTQTNQEVK